VDSRKRNANLVVPEEVFDQMMAAHNSSFPLLVDGLRELADSLRTVMNRATVRAG
jgi:hypothetical protein